MGVSGRKDFVNSAGTAGPIRTRDGSFDAPERRNDDGGGHVALRIYRARCRRVKLRKMLCQGCSPNGKWPGAQTFRSEAPWSELCAIRRISPEGLKLCPLGAILFFSALCPLPSQHAHVGPRWVPCGQPMWAPHGFCRVAPSGTQVGQPRWDQDGSHVGPTWDQCGVFVGFCVGSVWDPSGPAQMATMWAT